jgi:hypothetical protein
MQRLKHACFLFLVKICEMEKVRQYFIMGGGRNVEFHYYDWQFFFRTSKMAFELITTTTSQRRKWLLS